MQQFAQIFGYCLLAWLFALAAIIALRMLRWKDSGSGPPHHRRRRCRSGARPNSLRHRLRERYRVGLGTVEKLTGFTFMTALDDRAHRILAEECPDTMLH